MSAKQFEKLHDEVLHIVVTALRDLPHLVEGAVEMNMKALVPEAIKQSLPAFLGAHLATREREIRDQRRQIDRLNHRVEGLVSALEQLGAPERCGANIAGLPCVNPSGHEGAHAVDLSRSFEPDPGQAVSP